MGDAHRAVLVTGASRGIGKATAQAFLNRGARVAINGRTVESVLKAIAELGGHDRLVAAPGDVATVAGCKAAVGAALDAFGGLDVLVNNAGVYSRANMAESEEALWDSMINVNVKGTYFCSRSALPALKAACGVIVNVASEAGLRGYAGITMYCASKGAVVNLTRSMARELAPEVRVNCVCPGVIDTDMARARGADALRDDADYYPLKRIGTADEVAKAILYLASPDAGFITGAALAIDGGATAGG
jgi:NAD(P)-dependent dehydrogenase (short-subunit alcohol dehydrogenase family)